jgi:hypothetical protein
MMDKMMEQRAARDGCGCPLSTVRCCHFDGQVLVLTNDDPANDMVGHTCSGGWRPFTDIGYGLHLVPEGLVPCARTAECPAMLLPGPCKLCLEFGLDDLPAALAEFARCEAELLGREA